MRVLSVLASLVSIGSLEAAEVGLLYLLNITLGTAPGLAAQGIGLLIVVALGVGAAGILWLFVRMRATDRAPLSGVIDPSTVERPLTPEHRASIVRAIELLA